MYSISYVEDLSNGDDSEKDTDWNRFLQFQSFLTTQLKIRKGIFLDYGCGADPITFDMVKYFYDQSTTRKSFDAYSTEFAAYAAHLKTTRMTNPEIIEKLKCL